MTKTKVLMVIFLALLLLTLPLFVTCLGGSDEGSAKRNK